MEDCDPKSRRALEALDSVATGLTGDRPVPRPVGRLSLLYIVLGSAGSTFTGTECLLTPKVLSKVGTASDCLLTSL